MLASKILKLLEKPFSYGNGLSFFPSLIKNLYSLENYSKNKEKKERKM